MAASKSYFPRSNFRFLPSDREMTNNSMIFELEESDVWNSAARSQSPELCRPCSRLSRKPVATSPAARGPVSGPASLPVNIPDWSKILKDEYKENRRRDSDDDDYDEDDAAETGGRVPPHEFLARTRIASSMQEGIGRTLKGRDLNMVRNAIWQKVGFQD